MNKKQGVFSMKQGIGNIAVEGKHIVKDFRLGATTTKGLKDISLQVMQGEFVSIMDHQAPGKARCFIFLGDWMFRPVAASFWTAPTFPCPGTKK